MTRHAPEKCGLEGRLPVDSLRARRGALFAARRAHLQKAMRAADLPALLTIDPNHILYASGAQNMTIFGSRTPARYLLLFANGPAILFDFAGCEHLARGLETIDEIRPALGLDFVSAGGALDEACALFAREIGAALRDHDPSVDRIGLDRFPYQAVDALRGQGFAIVDAQAAMCRARAIKLPIELPYMREALARVEEGVRRLEEEAAPERTEAEIWAAFHYELMAKEGQYVVTRLFQSGPNTHPYFQETGPRAVEAGDLLCLDTDAIGYEGYAVDFSRTFLAGDGKASPAQKLLYGRALEQLETNAALLRPGLAFEELAQRAWRIPEDHQKSRYFCIGHGLGLAGEFPNIPHADGGPYPLDGALEPGMVICLESYVGWERSAEGVKLEDQFLIHEDRVERMSTYAFDSRLAPSMI